MSDATISRDELERDLREALWQEAFAKSDYARGTGSFDALEEARKRRQELEAQLRRLLPWWLRWLS